MERSERPSWQVRDAGTRKVLRYLSATAGQTETIDVGAGNYLIAFDGKAEISPVAVTVSAGQASRATTPVGQITFSWKGANATSWQVLDAGTRKPLRYLSIAGGATETVDVAPGSFLLTFDGKPEIAPVPVTVKAGQDSRVTTPVGQVIFTWNGANNTAWQLHDASTRKVIRYASVAAGQSDTLDVAPGTYTVALAGKPDFKPVAVTVAAGQAARVSLPATGR